MNLILHLGYPKTGTTYLQRRVIRQLSESHAIITPEFENCGVNIRKFMRDVHLGKSSRLNKKGIGDRDLVISLEGFLLESMRRVRAGRFCPASLKISLAGLKLLADDLQAEKVDVVVYFRRQDQLIHSVYAESNAFHFARCERLNSLEKYTSAVVSSNSQLSHPGYLYNFNNFFIDLLEEFSGQDTHARFYENLRDVPLQEIEFWSVLAGRPLINDITFENVRTVDRRRKSTDQSNWVKYFLLVLKDKYFSNIKLSNQASR